MNSKFVLFELSDALKGLVAQFAWPVDFAFGIYISLDRLVMSSNRDLSIIPCDAEFVDLLMRLLHLIAQSFGLPLLFEPLDFSYINVLLSVFLGS